MKLLYVAVLFTTILVLTVSIMILWHITPVFAISFSEESPITDNVNAALNFTIQYNSTLVDRESINPFRMVLWIEASPEVIQQIKSVSYVPYPGFEGVPYNVNSSENKFAQSLRVIAGPKVNATVHFKDGNFVEYPTLRTSVEIPPDMSPIDFLIDARLVDSSLTINGKTIPKENIEITKIRVDWGDGSISEPKSNLSFSHLYSKPVPPVVYIIVGIKNTDIPDSLETFVTQGLYTSPLIIAKSIPKDDSPISISRNGEAILTLETNLKSMQEDTPMRFNVSGNLFSLNSTGPGIINQPILIDFRWLEYPDRYERTENVTTRKDGYYTLQDTLTLKEGNYKISARPANSKFMGASIATKNLVVYGNPLTSEQLITYLVAGIGTGLAVIGAVIKIPGYITSVKQTNILSRYLSKINKEYYQFSVERSINKDEFVRKLEEIRNNITHLLEKRKINENQYKMLDDKITYYTDNLAKSSEVN